MGNDYTHIRIERRDAVTTVILDRPEKRNALARDVLLELTDAFEQVGRSDALGVVLAATGPVFSAGHNFADMLDASLPQAHELFDI